MDANRILNALGGSYGTRLSPFLPDHQKETFWTWKNRKKIPQKYRGSIRRALVAHAEEVAEIIAELDKQGAP